ncbi:patatin-like phospholipase family protein [candidate division KSB1 bacterium]|nr:patatin-like phospholipase family protein [candidate division KSB1 bacterium]
MKSNKALVLSGGSIRGAFQAGAVAEILTSGRFVPDAIYGTSVGSLNGAFLADRAGRAVMQTGQPDWVEIGYQLLHFWQKEITAFARIGSRRSWIRLLCSIIFKRFNGFVDTAALDRLVRQQIKREHLLNSPVKFYACAVNVSSGETVYASAQQVTDIHDYIMASTCIPGVMPLRIIRGEPYVDGGIREVAPLNRAIEDGAEEIYCVVCQPEKTPRTDFNHRDAIALMDNLMGIVTDELVDDDINLCRQINNLLQQIPRPIRKKPLRGKRFIDLKVIRPDLPIDLQLQHFTRDEITRALEYGRVRAQQLC